MPVPGCYQIKHKLVLGGWGGVGVVEVSRYNISLSRGDVTK